MRKLAIIILVCTAVCAAGEMRSLKIGEKAPGFVLKNYDGKEYTLDGIIKQNKLTALMFISTQCPISNAYNKRMTDLYTVYNGNGVAFVGINSNKEEMLEEISSHSKDNGFRFPVLKDEQNKIADTYGAQVTPEIYVVDQRGTLMYHGRIDDNRNANKVETRDLTAALDALLAGEEPPRTETKAFGCTIKRVSKD